MGGKAPPPALTPREEALASEAQRALEKFAPPSAEDDEGDRCDK